MGSVASSSGRSDTLRTVDVLRRFDRHGNRSMSAIAGLSFLGGLSEAGILVLVTSVAVSTTQQGRNISLGPISLTQREVLAAASGLLAVNISMAFAISRAIARTSSQSSLHARQQLLTAFHHASYQRKSRDRVAALQEALTTYVDRFTIAFSALGNLLAALLNLASFALAALIVNLYAALALAMVGGLLALVLQPAAHRTRAAAQALVGQRRLYTEGATESVLLAREEAVFGVAGVAGEHLRLLDAGVAHHFERTRFLSAFTPRIYQALAFGVAILGLLVLSSIEVSDLAAIGAVVLLLVRSLAYGREILASLQDLSEQRPYVDRLIALMDSYESEPRHRGRVRIGPISRIDLCAVTFAYPDGEAALSEFDLSIDAGETVGVVGPSGAGKTTLVNLLLRLYDPSTGQMLVNGVDLADVNDEEWHSRTAIVPQEPRLLLGTIADNIRFLRDLPDEVVRHAAEEANIADFVRTLPQGFEAPVGELGSGLSGGQRQRICIARALAGAPDLLVLDEPTSALDGQSEAAIQQTLEALKGKVTMVVVAHRLSTLSICDRLIILQDGRLAAAGSPAELAATSNYYKEALRFAGL